VVGDARHQCERLDALSYLRWDTAGDALGGDQIVVNCLVVLKLLAGRQRDETT
jgi:hypothetical protein